MNKYLVQYTQELEWGSPGDTVNIWESFDDYEDASNRYQQLRLSTDIRSASISIPVVSSEEVNITSHYTHDTVIRAYEQYKDAERSCEDLEALEELSEYGGTDLPPQEEHLIRAFACIEGMRATGRG